MSGRIWTGIAASYLVLCLLFGGASAAGALANAFLQALAVILVLALLWSGRLTIPGHGRLLFLAVGLFLLVGLATLIPLPLAVWSSLPFRGHLAEELRLLGIEAGSLAMSLAPSGTIVSLLALLPPTAMFLLTAALPADRRGWLFGTLVATTILSISLGVVQLLGGPQSGMRFYEITNDMSAVGLFANVNHNVTLALCTLPCLAAFAARFTSRRERSRRSGAFIISIACVVFIVLGIVLMRSMAGYALLLPALAGSALIYWRAIVARIAWGWRIAIAALGVAFIALALLGPLSQQKLSDKFDDSPTSRRVIAETTLGPVADSFPVGTGLGSFADVYRRYQDPDAATNEFVNHAHNDHLEIALELGLPGLLILLIFILWWAGRSLRIWRDDFPNAASARAGSVIIAMVLLHSLVDYPIRTAAIAAVFAMGCALMLPPRPSARLEQQREHARGRHLKVGVEA